MSLTNSRKRPFEGPITDSKFFKLENSTFEVDRKNPTSQIVTSSTSQFVKSNAFGASNFSQTTIVRKAKTKNTLNNSSEILNNNANQLKTQSSLLTTEERTTQKKRVSWNENLTQIKKIPPRNKTSEEIQIQEYNHYYEDDEEEEEEELEEEPVEIVLKIPRVKVVVNEEELKFRKTVAQAHDLFNKWKTKVNTMFPNPYFHDPNVYIKRLKLNPSLPYPMAKGENSKEKDRKYLSAQQKNQRPNYVDSPIEPSEPLRNFDDSIIPIIPLEDTSDSLSDTIINNSPNQLNNLIINNNNNNNNYNNNINNNTHNSFNVNQLTPPNYTRENSSNDQFRQNVINNNNNYNNNNNSQKKNNICRYNSMPGGCKRGSRCEFRHV